MKNISLDEFKTLVNRNDWLHQQELAIEGHEEREFEQKYETYINIPFTFGTSYLTSTLESFKISYLEVFEYNDYDAQSLCFGQPNSLGLEEVWSFEGFKVIDEEGEEISIYDLIDYMPSAFSEIDYNVLNIEQALEVEVDLDKSSAMENFKLKIENAPDIHFTGELLAFVSSDENNSGRWTELVLYKTKSGRYICHQIGRTRYVNERDRFSGRVCNSAKEIIEFFGHQWLAKKLYEASGLEDAVNID